MGTVAFLRNYHIAKYLSKYFDSADLITIKNISIPLSDKIPNDFINEHRVLNFDYRNFGNLISSKNNNIRNKANAKSNSRKVRVIRKILDNFPVNTVLGEGGLLYIINGTLRGIRLVRNKKITHIYSSFRPVADHIIAYNLKLFFPDLNWTADFRDPPVVKSRNASLFYKLQWWFLYKLLSKSNQVIAVSDGVSEPIKMAYPNTKTIKNGIYDLFKQEKSKYDKFTLSFTGSLYPVLQNPAILFAVLKTLLDKNTISKDDFQLIYAGKDADNWNEMIREYSLEDISINRREVSLQESIQIQGKSHINLIFTWSDDHRKGILTGKLYEYLNTGNPIFAFVNGDTDTEFERIFDNINAGYVFYNNDKEKIENQISELYSQWKNKGRIDFSYNENEIRKYSWENRTKQLMDLIFNPNQNDEK